MLQEAPRKNDTAQDVYNKLITLGTHRTVLQFTEVFQRPVDVLIVRGDRYQAWMGGDILKVDRPFYSIFSPTHSAAPATRVTQYKKNSDRYEAIGIGAGSEPELLVGLCLKLFPDGGISTDSMDSVALSSMIDIMRETGAIDRHTARSLHKIGKARPDEVFDSLKILIQEEAGRQQYIHDLLVELASGKISPTYHRSLIAQTQDVDVFFDSETRMVHVIYSSGGRQFDDAYTLTEPLVTQSKLTTDTMFGRSRRLIEGSRGFTLQSKDYHPLPIGHAIIEGRLSRVKPNDLKTKGLYWNISKPQQ